MQRKYTYIKDFEKELIEYIEQGHTLREAGEKYGFTYKEMRDFKTRYNKNQRKLAAGIAIKLICDTPTINDIKEMDKTFIAKNLSPGGSADLLAITYFLSELENI